MRAIAVAGAAAIATSSLIVTAPTSYADACDGQVVLAPNGTPICMPAPRPPAALDVSWQPFPGGITATVKMTNNPTKGPVRCVYSTQGLETFDRAFTLAGDQPTNVVIAPAVPLNRYWPVSVSCDNGVRTDTGSVY
jgi:hypothetical protein